MVYVPHCRGVVSASILAPLWKILRSANAITFTVPLILSLVSRRSLAISNKAGLCVAIPEKYNIYRNWYLASYGQLDLYMKFHEHCFLTVTIFCCITVTVAYNIRYALRPLTRYKCHIQRRNSLASRSSWSGAKKGALANFHRTDISLRGLSYVASLRIMNTISMNSV